MYRNPCPRNPRSVGLIPSLKSPRAAEIAVRAAAVVGGAGGTVDVDGATFRLYGCERRVETQTIELPKVEGQRNSLRCPAWSSNGRLLATVVPHNMAFDSGLEDYDRLALWDVRLRKLLGALTIPSRVRPNQLVFAPSNDKIISVHSDKLLMLWDAKKIVPSVARRPSVRISHLIGRTGLTGGKYAT